MTKSSTPFPFEKTLQELETLVNRMESEALPLEEALKQFEKGVALTQTCQKALTEAEQKVKLITQKGDLS